MKYDYKNTIDTNCVNALSEIANSADQVKKIKYIFSGLYYYYLYNIFLRLGISFQAGSDNDSQCNKI